MNSKLADAAAGEGPREAAPAARIGTASTLLMLVRRELWEHRALWIAPLVVAALMVCGAVVAGLKYHLRHGDMSGEDRPGSMAMFAGMQGAASTPLSWVSLIVLPLYLRDRLRYRTYGIWPPLFGHMQVGRGRAVALGAALDRLNLGAALTDLNLWIGLAVAAAMVFGAIRLRRYRDDT